MKRFLLFIGQEYYPKEGLDDFVGSYGSLDEAKSILNAKRSKREFGRWAHIYDITKSLIDTVYSERDIDEK